MTAPTVPRREQLLEAAAVLLAERGDHAVRIDDIGAAAGISGPGVDRHVPGEQALLAALSDRAPVVGAALAVLHATALATSAVPRERLARLLRTAAPAALLAPRG